MLSLVKATLSTPPYPKGNKLPTKIIHHLTLEHGDIRRVLGALGAYVDSVAVAVERHGRSTISPQEVSWTT